MPTLQLTLHDEARCPLPRGLPPGFLRAVQQECTLLIPAHGKTPARVMARWLQQGNMLRFPLDYVPDFLARADEHGIAVNIIDVRRKPDVIERQVAVDLRDLGFGFQVLREQVGALIPGTWPVVALRVIAYQYTPIEGARPKEASAQEWAEFQGEAARGAPRQSKIL